MHLFKNGCFGTFMHFFHIINVESPEHFISHGNGFFTTVTRCRTAYCFRLYKEIYLNPPLKRADVGSLIAAAVQMPVNKKKKGWRKMAWETEKCRVRKGSKELNVIEAMNCQSLNRK